MSQTVNKKPEAAVSASPINHAKKRVFTPLRIVLLSGIAFLLIVIIVCSVIALTYNRVYPNISAFGVSLGGLSREEAAAALSEELLSAYSEASVTLSLDGQELIISALEAGVSLSSEKTAEATFSAGRQGNIFSRLSFAVSSLFTERSIEEDSDFSIDRQAILTIVRTLMEQVSKSPVEYTWSIGESSIEINGGIPGTRCDAEAMADAIIQAFRNMDFTPLSFVSEIIEPAPLPLEMIYELVNVEPVPAYVALDDDKQAKLVPHVNGVSFDMQKAREALSGQEPVTIPLVHTTPSPTLSELEESLFRDMLGEYQTSTAGSSANRVNNIARTTDFINGVILLPGDQFSFNDIVGQRTEQRGFKPAGAYINGKLIDDIGGGICQSSTTLYNAALLANLKIVSRRNHSMTVGYVPVGQDATVDFGNIDFVFENDTGYPIRIEMTHADSRLNTRIFGTKTDDLTVSIEMDYLSVTRHEQLTEMNPSLAPGVKRTKQNGHDGVVVQTYRVLTDSQGNEVYRNPEAKSTYRKVDHITEVGPGAPSDIPGVPRGGTPPPSPPPEEPSPPPTEPSETPPEPSPSPIEPSPSPVEPDLSPPEDSTYYPPSPSPRDTETNEGESADDL